ncbi:DUF983 domain-containing protein [Chthonobacter rhizosphaerae]|uniref:DUF983 domain-containing protein n=1 Tax=Chthonobacter rhizosphaerae TaxID=2735553 RepID=UPI0015EFA234|nr:DUF983 domain-containing protein [Chthonobacter rhizosphaerae]
MAVETWTAGQGTDTPVVLPKRDVWTSIRRGLAGRCPHCGKGRLFGRYLKVVDRCEACGEEYSHHRADDLPPYITIVIVGHVVIPAVLWVEQVWSPEDWVQMAIWLPVTVLMTLLLLQPIKGGVVGLQWAAYMHGFHPSGPDDLDRTHVTIPEGQRGG